MTSVADVAVLIPFASEDPWRLRALERVRAAYESLPVVLGACDSPWSKGRAVQDALRRTENNVLVVADADCLPPPDRLRTAIEAVAGGKAWGVPHSMICRLTREATETGGSELEERPYPGRTGGGIVVLRRDVLEAIPLDPRFEGWGEEDLSWGYALTVLAGPPVWLPGDLVHLWHPPADRPNRSFGSRENRALARRYRHARYDLVEMQGLVAEAREASYALL